MNRLPGVLLRRDRASAGIGVGLLPRGYIDGLILSNDPGDPDHDINVTAGEATDDTNSESMVLSSEITKRVDASWVVGDDQGGSDTGLIIADTWLYLHLIKRSDTGVVDVLFSDSATSPTMPDGYDFSRRIGAALLDGSANIIAFFQEGRDFYWDLQVNDEENTGGLTLTENLVTMTVPPLEEIKAKFSCHLFDNTATNPTYVLVRPTRVADTTPTEQLANLAARITDGGNGHVSADFDMHVDSSGQIAYRAQHSTADHEFRITTWGWADPAGKE